LIYITALQGKLNKSRSHGLRESGKTKLKKRYRNSREKWGGGEGRRRNSLSPHAFGDTAEKEKEK